MNTLLWPLIAVGVILTCSTGSAQQQGFSRAPPYNKKFGFNVSFGKLLESAAHSVQQDGANWHIRVHGSGELSFDPVRVHLTPEEQAVMDDSDEPQYVHLYAAMHPGGGRGGRGRGRGVLVTVVLLLGCASASCSRLTLAGQREVRPAWIDHWYYSGRLPAAKSAPRSAQKQHVTTTLCCLLSFCNN